MKSIKVFFFSVLIVEIITVRCNLSMTKKMITFALTVLNAILSDYFLKLFS